MNRIVSAITDISDWFTDRRLSHFFVGDVAVAQWGEPALRAHIDVCVVPPAEKTRSILDDLLVDFDTRSGLPADEFEKMRVVLLRSDCDVPIDVSLGLPELEFDVAGRAKYVEVAPDKLVPVCAPEDLVVYKMLAARPCDKEDAESIIARQGTRFDVTRARAFLRRFCDALKDTAALDRFEELWHACGPDAIEECWQTLGPHGRE